ncbi:MAG: phospholipase [Gemmatimonadetes bacterium]|nr:phospholipase [Gemmatimonadota bacterium]
MEPHVGQPIETTGRPLGEGRAVMIMIHGRQAAPVNILQLVDSLSQPEFTYIAPAAANNTWYPYSFMADKEQNEPGISSGVAVIDGVVSDVVNKGIPKDHIVLLGFSQGACLTAEYAVEHADRFGGVILYSGSVIGPPGTTWAYGGSFDGTPIFMGCSDVDSHVPLERIEEGAAVFERMGAIVTKRIYPGMGHQINDDEIAFTQGLMRNLLA